jgi:hypothetical protein
MTHEPRGVPAAAEPPGALIVSGGGTTMVATDDLLAEAAMLRALHGEAREWQTQLTRIRSLEFEPGPSWEANGRAASVYAAARAVDAVEEHSRQLSHSLIAAAEEYGEADRLVELLTRYAGAGTGYALGRLGPLLAVLAVPALSGAAIAWLLARLVGGRPFERAPAVAAEWLRNNPRLLTNPVIVRAVRVLVSSLDDVAAGALGVPPALSFPLGDEGVGVLGVSSSAAVALAASRPFGLLRETPISARSRGMTTRVQPPVGLGGLAARIPPATGNGPQVRIERYGTPAAPTWIVYVAGTVGWDPDASEEPWDVTSDVAALAEQEAGSYRAVVQAMHDAGVHGDDPVVQVGHSQGGLIAAQIAASGEFNTVAVATFGAPAGQVPVPDTVPMVATEHSDDLVPALGGTPRDTAAPGVHHLVVRREVYADRALPQGDPLPAHSLVNYTETARLMDASLEPRLVEFRATLADVLGPEPGEATAWRANRNRAE